MNKIVRATGSPFDALKRFDDRGEYWLASEICKPIGYTWRRFPGVIERAVLALRANGEDPNEHIESRTLPSKISPAHSTQDWRLTRYGAYTVVQGGDPSKLEIAAGWAYFRVRTREAELATRQDIPQTLQEALRAYADAVDAKEVSQALAIEARLELDVFMVSESNEEIGAVARMLDVSPTKFQEFLRDVGVMGKARNLDGVQGVYNKPIDIYRHRNDLFGVRNKRVLNGKTVEVTEATPAGQVELKRIFDEHWSQWCTTNNRRPDGTLRDQG